MRCRWHAGGLAIALAAPLAGCTGSGDDTDPISCGWVDGVDPSVDVATLDTGLRHFKGVVVFAWLELRGGCIVGGEVIDAISDLPFDLIPGEADDGSWGTWHLEESIGERLTVRFADGSSLCYGSACDTFPAPIDDPTGPWVSAEEWYEAWLARHGW